MKVKLRNFYPILAGVVLLSSTAIVSSAMAESPSGADQSDAYSCLYDICVGDSVQVISGRWIGHGGRVISVDARSQTLTAINGSQYYIYPSVYDVYVSDRPRVDPCAGNVCIGDEVRIVGRRGLGIGRVTATDSYRYTATVIVAGRSFHVSVRDLVVVSQAPPTRYPPTPYPPTRYPPSRDLPDYPRQNRQGNGSGRVEQRNPRQQGNCPIGTRPNPRVGGRCTAT